MEVASHYWSSAGTNDSLWDYHLAWSRNALYVITTINQVKPFFKLKLRGGREIDVSFPF